MGNGLGMIKPNRQLYHSNAPDVTTCVILIKADLGYTGSRFCPSDKPIAYVCFQ